MARTLLMLWLAVGTVAAPVVNALDTTTEVADVFGPVVRQLDANTTVAPTTTKASQVLQITATIVNSCGAFGEAGKASFAASLKNSTTLRDVASKITEVGVTCSESRRHGRVGSGSGSTVTAAIVFHGSVNASALAAATSALKATEVSYTLADGTTMAAKVTGALVMAANSLTKAPATATAATTSKVVTTTAAATPTSTTAHDSSSFFEGNSWRLAVRTRRSRTQPKCPYAHLCIRGTYV